MFKRILVAYDESPASGRALFTGINLAKSLNAELRASPYRKSCLHIVAISTPKSQAGLR